MSFSDWFTLWIKKKKIPQQFSGSNYDVSPKQQPPPLTLPSPSHTPQQFLPFVVVISPFFGLFFPFVWGEGRGGEVRTEGEMSIFI